MPRAPQSQTLEDFIYKLMGDGKKPYGHKLRSLFDRLNGLDLVRLDENDRMAAAQALIRLNRAHSEDIKAYKMPLTALRSWQNGIPQGSALEARMIMAMVNGLAARTGVDAPIFAQNNVELERPDLQMPHRAIRTSFVQDLKRS